MCVGRLFVGTHRFGVCYKYNTKKTTTIMTTTTTTMIVLMILSIEILFHSLFAFFVNHSPSHSHSLSLPPSHSFFACTVYLFYFFPVIFLAIYAAANVTDTIIAEGIRL